MKQPLTVTIELTPELLQVLSPEATKKILLDLITETDKISHTQKNEDDDTQPTSHSTPVHNGDTQPKLSCWNKKISDADVQEIYRRYLKGERLNALADEFGYKYSSITTAVQRLKKKVRTTTPSEVVKAVEPPKIEPVEVLQIKPVEPLKITSEKPIKYLPYQDPIESLEPITVHETRTWENGGQSLRKEDAKVLAKKMLDDPKIPLWRPEEMYSGIWNDKDILSIEELSHKYGMTTTRIQGIIKNNCYQTF